MALNSGIGFTRPNENKRLAIKSLIEGEVFKNDIFHALSQSFICLIMSDGFYSKVGQQSWLIVVFFQGGTKIETPCTAESDSKA